MGKVVIDLELKYKEAAFEIEQLNKQIVKLENEVEKTKETSIDLGGELDAVSGGAITKFKKLTGVVGGVVKGFKTMRAAIAATGLGLLVVVIASIVQAFKNSEAGQNKFAKLMTVIGSVVGNVMDVLSKFGMAIIEAFENPKKTIKDFGNSIKEFVLERFNRLIDGLGLLGRAIKKAFSGDFAGALEDTKDGLIKVNTAINPVAIAAEGVYNTIKKTAEATKDLVDEIARDAKIAADLADRRAAADIRERELLVERAKANVEINKLRTKAAEVDKFTSEQRIFFLEKAASIEDEITAKEVDLAKIRRDIKIQENSLSESKKEDLEEEAQLVAEVISLEEQRLIKNKELLGVAAGLRKAEADRRAAERQAEIDSFKKQQDQITNTLKDSITKRDEFRIEAEKVTSQQLLDVERQKAEQNALFLQYQAENQAKLDIARQNSLDNIIAIAGAESKVGKAAFLAKQALMIQELVMEARKTITFATQASAKASIATAEGAAQTAKVGFPQNVPLLIAYAAQAAGIIMSIKSAVQTAKGSTAGIGGSVATPRGASTPSVPMFNVVGASPENQLAETLGTQEQKPIKAFVVSNEVSNAQALDRNIIKGASIG